MQLQVCQIPVAKVGLRLALPLTHPDHSSATLIGHLSESSTQTVGEMCNQECSDPVTPWALHSLVLAAFSDNMLFTHSVQMGSHAHSAPRATHSQREQTAPNISWLSFCCIAAARCFVLGNSQSQGKQDITRAKCGQSVEPIKAIEKNEDRERTAPANNLRDRVKSQRNTKTEPQARANPQGQKEGICNDPFNWPASSQPGQPERKGTNQRKKAQSAKASEGPTQHYKGASEGMSSQASPA